MKRIQTAIACTAALALTALAQAPTPPLPPETPLVVDGPVRVEVADFEGNILRIPEDKRAGFRMSYDRVASVVDNIYVARSLAQKARDEGLDRDPAVQARLKQLQDGFLSELYVQKLAKDAPKLDLEGRARELYIADREKFMTEEEVHAQQILVGTTCRTLDAARTMAQRAYEEAKGGKADFLALADKYSDEGPKALRGGDIGTGPLKKLAPPVREALSKLKPGEISEPVETQFGVHVLKLVARKPPEPKPFEAVKNDIIAAERARLQRARVDNAVAAVRSSSTVVTHRANVEKLVAPGLDLDALSRAAREAHKAAAPAPVKP